MQEPRRIIVTKITDTITTFSSTFLRANRFKFGLRATLITLPVGNHLIFSPPPITPEVESQLNSLSGTVEYILAPDIEHYLHVGKWKQKYPNAVIIAPDGIKLPDECTPTHVFTAENKENLTTKLSSLFNGVLDFEYWDGHANKEIAVLHKPSRTLIAADLVFNLPAYEQYAGSDEDADSGIWTKIAVNFLSATKSGIGHNLFNWLVTYSPCLFPLEPGVLSNLLNRVIASKDKKSFADSASRVSKWDIDRIIPCHGDVIETNGLEVFERLFKWHIKIKKD
jgi:hypothetical protein